MTGNDLAKMYEFSYGAINRNLQDLNHEDSLVSPDAGGNCLNWVLGPRGYGRGTVLMLAGANPVFTGERHVAYRRGSHPEGTEGFVDLATLRGCLDDTQQQLIPALAALSEEALEPARPGRAETSAADRLHRRRAHPAALSRGLPQRPDWPAA